MDMNIALVVTLVGSYINIGCTYETRTEQEIETIHEVYNWFVNEDSQMINFNFRDTQYALSRNFITSMRILNMGAE